MNAKWTSRMPLALGAALILVALIVLARNEPARSDVTVVGTAPSAAPGAGPRYSVIDTEGHNLIVTDNQSNSLYFYTIDKDKEIGTELKLRGTVDLTQVGKPAIKLMKPKAE